MAKWDESIDNRMRFPSVADYMAEAIRMEMYIPSSPRASITTRYKAYAVVHQDRGPRSRADTTTSTCLSSLIQKSLVKSWSCPQFPLAERRDLHGDP